MESMIRCALLTFTKQTMGRVRRPHCYETSFRCRGKLKNDSSSGESRLRRLFQDVAHFLYSVTLMLYPG